MASHDGTDRNRFARRLFDPLPSRYDRLAEVLSFGQNRRWRRAMVDAVAAGRPGRILDVATGTGAVAIEMVRRTGASVVGVDLTEAMLRVGARRIDGAGAAAPLVLGRAERLPFDEASFDALTFTYLLRYVDDAQATLSELARVVRPGGTVASLEFLAPPRAFWRLWWWLYTRLVLPLAGFVTGGRAWFAVGAFLGPSISTFTKTMPPPRQVALWEKAGIEDVHTKVMSLGGGLVMWGRRAGG